MPVKILGWIISLCILWACSSTKVIKLAPAEGASREFGSRSLFVEGVNADAHLANFAGSLGMDSLFVGRFNHYPSSYSVSVFTNEVYYGDSQEYLENHRRIITGTSPDIPVENFNTEILFLFGKKKDGSYIVVPDQNNNKSFNDDSVFVFNSINQNFMVSTKGLESFPHIKIDNVKSFYNKKFTTFSFHLIIEPLLSIDPDKEENRNALSLRVASVEYKTGTFKFKGNKYQVAARNALLPYLYFDPRVIKIKFADATDSTAFQKIRSRQPTYYIGDTVLLGKQKVRILKVSPFLDKITIKALTKTR
jgi:hypothetical protein